MEYFINQWGGLGAEAKQVIVICSLVMIVVFYVLVKVLAAHDKVKYGPDEDDEYEYDDED